MSTIEMPATTNASTGATMRGHDDLADEGAGLDPEVPTAASIAPTTPPIRACEELEGSPKNQVTRFQTIAPISPANTIGCVVSAESTMPVATVAATFSEMNAPAKLSSGGDRDRHRAATARGSRSTTRRRWRCRESRW